MDDTRPFTIPELIGHTPIPYDRRRAYSRAAYQAQYALTSDEAADLLREFAPDDQARNTAHPHIDQALHRRLLDDPAYKQRVMAAAHADDLADDSALDQRADKMLDDIKGKRERGV